MGTQEVKPHIHGDSASKQQNRTQVWLPPKIECTMLPSLSQRSQNGKAPRFLTLSEWVPQTSILAGLSVIHMVYPSHPWNQDNCGHVPFQRLSTPLYTRTHTLTRAHTPLLRPRFKA